MKITILGAGAWGSALAISLARSHEITLWSRDAAHLAEIARTRRNDRYLPGFDLPPAVRVEPELARAIGGAQLVLVVVPTAGFRATLRQLAACDIAVPVIWAAKGFEPETAKLLHQVAEEELPGALERGVLSGPSFAHEVAQGLPCALTFAAREPEFARHTAVALNHNRMRVYSSTDVIGVELGGAVKNVMAIAAGISDGMGFGYNARAALITRGLAEMTRLGLCLGGRLETFMGLAGVGDLILTCTGDLSRNRTVGKQLAAGRDLATILGELGHTAEGVHTCAEVLRKARQLGIEMPITQEVYRVMFEGLSPRQAVEDLLSREPKAEYRSA
ncbi:MAG: NAD(P)H-dependent glycerol-3-phosphate dehydrogenase [Burkholderiales bacterium]